MADPRGHRRYPKDGDGKMSARVSFSDQIRRVAMELGFDAVGIARAGPDVKLDRDFAAYASFVRAGMQAEMDWLGKQETFGVRESLDGEGILPGARSVVCLARRYGPASGGLVGGAADLSFAGGIARYARGHDYHGFLRRRLRRLAAFVRSLGTAERPVEARPLCDEEPVLERAWAARAGLGFVGKNGMIIVPGTGSMVLLGEVVTTLELDANEPIAERCGSCMRCLEACPTSAFVRPFVLDPRRCVSYLTIEHESAIAPDLREGMGQHLFGCDDCQTVCPFNAGSGARAPLDSGDGDPFAPLERWSRVRLEQCLSLDGAAWRALSEGTPLKRAGRSGLARNAAIVLGNRGDAAALPELRSAACHHDDPIVREAAEWAIATIERAVRLAQGGDAPPPRGQSSRCGHSA
jgi:epoxyqueuosine reductase